MFGRWVQAKKFNFEKKQVIINGGTMGLGCDRVCVYIGVLYSILCSRAV